MSQFSQTNRRALSMTPIHWVAIVCLVGIAVVEQMKDQLAPDTLEHFNRETLTIVRLSEPSFDFPILGVRVTPPDDWVYLSTTNPTLADQPTFYSVSNQSIIRLMHPALWQMNADQPEVGDEHVTNEDSESTVHPDVDKTNERGDSAVVQWYEASSMQQSLNLTIDGFPVEVSWPALTPYRIGRFRNGKIDLILKSLVTSSNHHATGTSPRSPAQAGEFVNQPAGDRSVAEFCLHVEAISR